MTRIPPAHHGPPPPGCRPQNPPVSVRWPKAVNANPPNSTARPLAPQAVRRIEIEGPSLAGSGGVLGVEQEIREGRPEVGPVRLRRSFAPARSAGRNIRGRRRTTALLNSRQRVPVSAAHAAALDGGNQAQQQSAPACSWSSRGSDQRGLFLCRVLRGPAVAARGSPVSLRFRALSTGDLPAKKSSGRINCRRKIDALKCNCHRKSVDKAMARMSPICPVAWPWENPLKRPGS